MKKNSKNYNNKKIVSNIISMMLNTLVLYIIGFTEVGKWFENAAHVSQNPIVNSFVFILFTLAAVAAANFPLSYYEGYFLEHEFNLSNQNIFSWGKRYIKENMLILIIGTFVIAALYLFLLVFKENWWMALFVFLIIFNFVLGIAAPVIIFPLFYKFTEIDNDEIKESIGRLIKEAGISIKGIYKFDMSKETRKANAAFTGFGKSKRIIIGDTLLDRFSTNEITAVFAHELGHYKLNHIKKNMFYGVIVLFILLFAAGKYEISNYSELANIYKIGFVIFMLQNFTMVTDNILSRKHEYEADEFAMKITGTCEHLVSALERLEDTNLADSEPNKLVEFIFYSHPSVAKRIRKLKGFENEKR